MTIAVAKDVEDFLREGICSGAVEDASNLVNDLLRSVRDQHRKPFVVTSEIESWLLESADKPATPLTEADFQGIRERAAARGRNSAA